MEQTAGYMLEAGDDDVTPPVRMASRMQQEQLAMVEARKKAEREAEAVEGQEILARSKAEIDEDRQKAWERKMWHKQNNEGEWVGPSTTTVLDIV